MIDCQEYLADITVPPVPGMRFQPCRNCLQAFADHENPWAKPDGCKACSLFREPGPVPGTGPKDASLAFIAEAPGAEEVDEERRQGRDRYPGAFDRRLFATMVGGTGRILTSMCAQAGIYRKDTYGTNVVKCRPPNNRPPTPGEIATCAKVFLADELDTINPNVVVPLGDTALVTTAGLKGITNNRGVAIEGYKRKDGTRQKLLPSWHPAFIIRSQHLWPFAVHDLARAKEQSAFADIRRVPYNIVIGAGTEASRGDLLARCRARRAATFDFETTGLSPHNSQIVLCGVTADGKQADVLDWSPRTAELLQAILDDPEIEVCGQNILHFDLPFAEGKKINIDKAWPKVFDDMVAFHLCNASYGNTSQKDARSAGRPGGSGTVRLRAPEKDLSMIASCHTDIPYWKSRDNYKTDLRKVCGIDVIATDRSAYDPTSGLKKELETYGMLDLYWKHVLPVHPVLHKMHKRGVRCDEPKAAAWRKAFLDHAAKTEQALKDGLGKPNLNLASSKQMMALLYDELGLEEQFIVDPKTKEKRRTADAIAIGTLADKYPEHKILAGITEIRHAKKMVSTFIDSGLMTDDMRFHPHIGASKTSNGRLNSWNPNGQNVPLDLREVWRADSDDDVLLVADWSQIEWRIAMVLSGDPVGLDLLARGVDTHFAVYAEAFEKKIEEVTLAEREVAKFLVYGLSYGRGAQSIADATAGVGAAGRDVGGVARAHAMRSRLVDQKPLDLAFVQEFVKRFAARFNKYWSFREEVIRFCRDHNYIVNGWGRRRWWYTNEVTEQHNYLPSSHAAEMMIDSLIMLDAQLPAGATLRLSVHDEIMVNANRGVAREAVKCMRDVMQSTWPKLEDFSADRATVRKFYPNGWHCPADIHAGPNWEICKTKNKARIAKRTEFEAAAGLTDLLH